jgi:protease I
MADQTLKGCRVAILVTDGFEQVELLRPRQALDDAGAITTVVSPKSDKVRGWNFTDWGDDIAVDLPLEQADADDFRRAVAAGRRDQSRCAAH